MCAHVSALVIEFAMCEHVLVTLAIYRFTDSLPWTTKTRQNDISHPSEIIFR